jgi:hypothetical protein
VITASPGVIIAGAASTPLVVLAAGYGLHAAIAEAAPIGQIPLTPLPTRICRPIVVFTAFGRRGLIDLVLASITAQPSAPAALVRYGAGTSTGNAALATIIQPHIPGGTRGRVFSRFDLIWQSMRLARLLPGGLLAGTACSWQSEIRPWPSMRCRGTGQVRPRAPAVSMYVSMCPRGT